jgi:hypothetical chaperone protein
MPPRLRPIPCGIDFGTSNSAIALMSGNGPQLVPVEGGHLTIPTAVFFDFEANAVRFGRRAIEDYSEGSRGRLMRALKSLLGSTLILERLRIKNRAMTYADIISLFIGHLRASAQFVADREIDHVVLGRPVHFVDDNPDADAAAQDQLVAAVRGLGFRHLEFQFEPIAAALDYEQSIAGEELAFIADLGGGTSDFSVVRVSPERARAPERNQDILANAGIHIGGGDFDRLLSLGKAMPHLGYATRTRDRRRELPKWCYVDMATWQRINFLNDTKAVSKLRGIRTDAEQPELVDRLLYVVDQRLGHRLAAAVEQAKISLTDDPATVLTFPLRHESLQIAISRTEFENAIETLIAGIADTMRLTLSQAGIASRDISAVFITGGSAQIPAVRREIAALFPDSKIVEGDIFGSVALGLALDARRKFGMPEQQ